MKMRIIKSFVLILLITASIYQIIMLWFDNVSDRNFFYSFINNTTMGPKASSTYLEKQYMIEPRHLGVFLGASDKDFTIIKKEDPLYDYEGLYSESIKAILKAVNKNNLEKLEPTYENLWKERGILFSLGLSMPKKALASDLNVNESIFNELSSVNTIGIIPANRNNEQLKVYFVDEETKEIYKFQLEEKDIRVTNNLLNDFITKAEDKRLPAYISTAKNDVDLFSKNILLPLAIDQLQLEDNLNISIPFVVDNYFEKDALERYINGFFANPNVKWITQNKDVMIYGDDNALIRYNKEGILEYSSIINNKFPVQSLSESYNIAERFLKMDNLLVDESYYLVEYLEQGNTTTFYYEYIFDHLPLLIQDETLRSNKMNHPLEIVVEKGKVIKYKKILTEISIIKAPQAFNVKFETALNKFVKDYKVEVGQLEDMYLAYTQKGEVGKIKWVIRYQGENYELE